MITVADIMIISCHNIYRRGYIVERADSPCKLVIYLVRQYVARYCSMSLLDLGSITEIEDQQHDGHSA